MSTDAKERKAWSAWRMNDDEVRVQINRADITKDFSKVKSVRSVGFSVCGDYLRLFHIKQSVQWVDDWMKEFMRQANNGLVKPKGN